VNCAAIPASLIESELFGHEKGAFTGAAQRHEGRIAEAEHGTLFLDEIASMPTNLQSSLLRVLQERRYQRLGRRGEIECDIRVVAASNRDLARLVREGSFREDLYYRLNVIAVGVPPLRDRREDIPLLAQTFLKRAVVRHGLPPRELPPKTLRRLMEYSWPGNVRELANAIERAALLSDGAIEESDLPPELRPGSGPGGQFELPPGGICWDELEASLLHQALEQAGGNRAAAARLLGLPYKRLLYRLEKHGLGADSA
jgi:DNA-binding NtrC family response regulator